MMALRADRRVWWAVGAAMLLHGALLTSTRQGISAHANGGLPRALSMVPHQWTLVTPRAPLIHPTPAAIEDTPATTTTLAGTDQATPPTEPATPTAQAVATVDAEFQEEPVQYWPRQDLDQGPTPLEPVVIPYPEERLELDTVRGVLALSIDAHGTVRRVDPQDDQLPALMVRAARDAFLQARFQPGQRQGQPVGSRIVIEVQFDPPLRPVQRGAAAPGL